MDSSSGCGWHAAPALVGLWGWGPKPLKRAMDRMQTLFSWRLDFSAATIYWDAQVYAQCQGGGPAAFYRCRRVAARLMLPGVMLGSTAIDPELAARPSCGDCPPCRGDHRPPGVALSSLRACGGPADADVAGNRTRSRAASRSGWCRSWRKDGQSQRWPAGSRQCRTASVSFAWGEAFSPLYENAHPFTVPAEVGDAAARRVACFPSLWPNVVLIGLALFAAWEILARRLGKAAPSGSGRARRRGVAHQQRRAGWGVRCRRECRRLADDPCWGRFRRSGR